LAAHFGKSFFVEASPDQTSMVWPTDTLPIAFFASSNGPGQADPRASTTLAGWTVFRSTVLMIRLLDPVSYAKGAPR
jgi:hypothetical protein